MKRAIGILAVAAAVSLGCRQTPADLREWRPSDHSGEQPSGPATPTANSADPTASAQALFLAQCASCHGSQGHGDGPQAALFRPADLTDGAFQSQRTDEELARAITQGRGRMPAFGSTVRPEGVQLLVRLIRSWRR